MRLSKNFVLEEFTTSQTAIRKGINNIPNNNQIDSLKRLCENVLQPIRDHYNLPLVISSGFRCEELNRMIGGSGTSQHCKGEAADFTVNIAQVPLFEQFETIVTVLDIPFDQIIYEFGSWIHISHKYEGEQRREILSAYRIHGKVRYKTIKF